MFFLPVEMVDEWIANGLDLFARLIRLWFITTSFDWRIQTVSITTWYGIYALVRVLLLLLFRKLTQFRMLPLPRCLRLARPRTR